MCFGTRVYKAWGLFNKQNLFYFFLPWGFSSASQEPVVCSTPHSTRWRLSWTAYMTSPVVESSNGSRGRSIHENPLAGKFLERSSNLKSAMCLTCRSTGDELWWKMCSGTTEQPVWALASFSPVSCHTGGGGSRWAHGSTCESERPSPWQPQRRVVQDRLQQLQAKDAAVRRGLVRGASLECWRLECYSERIDLCHCSLFFFFLLKMLPVVDGAFQKGQK